MKTIIEVGIPVRCWNALRRPIGWSTPDIKALSAGQSSRVAFWVCYLVLSLAITGFLFPLGDAGFATFILGSYVLTTLTALVFRRRFSTVISAIALAFLGALLALASAYYIPWLTNHL